MINEDGKRVENYQRTEHAFDLWKSLTTNPDSFAKPESRIEAIKKISADDLIRLLAFANGLLRKGEPGKPEDITPNMNISMVGVSDFEASPEARANFIVFFNKMKDEITVQNLENWATKLYAAIIYAHLFSDANGRLSRTAYHFLMTGELISSEKVVDRPSQTDNFATAIYHQTIMDLLSKEIEISRDSEGKYELFDYVAVDNLEDVMLAQLTSVVKYIAAVRVLKRHQLFKDQKEIILSDKNTWDDVLKKEYDEEYKKVRSEIFFHNLDLLDKYPVWVKEAIQPIFD